MSWLLVWLLSKVQKIASVSKVIEQRKHLGAVDGSKNGTALWKTIWRFLKKLKMQLSIDPAIPVLGVYLKEIKSLFQRGICTFMFIATLFTVAKEQKQPVYQQMYKKWIRKSGIYKHGLFSLKRRKSCYLRQCGWNWKSLCEMKCQT